MDQLQFLAELGLPQSSFPASVRWVMEDGGRVAATARLDYEAVTDELEFGVYEPVAGETAYTTGIARRDRRRGEISFVNDDVESFFERFCETVRSMRIESIEEAESLP